MTPSTETRWSTTTLRGAAPTSLSSPRRMVSITIVDFRGSDGDIIDLAATELAWTDLDTNSNSVLDDGDYYVASDGSNTQIDLGAATGESVADLNVVTVAGVTGLTVVDFLFA